MNVGLFVRCYLDQFYPNAAIATLQLLEKLGVSVTCPRNQTCCGQPMANSGFEHLNKGCNESVIINHSEFNYTVTPSDSCVLHIKEHLHSLAHEREAKQIGDKIFELSSFLIDVLKVESLPAKFPFKDAYTKVVTVSAVYTSCK